jgi:hypothetical protein
LGFAAVFVNDIKKNYLSKQHTTQYPLLSESLKERVRFHNVYGNNINMFRCNQEDIQRLCLKDNSELFRNYYKKMVCFYSKIRTSLERIGGIND